MPFNLPMHYDPTSKPDPAICPRQFCFLWRMNERIVKKEPEPQVLAAGCRSPFGLCTRLDALNGDYDWYEPHELNLKEAGLPWFYFISTPAKIVRNMRKKYVAEPEALWGEKHWEEVKE